MRLTLTLFARAYCYNMNITSPNRIHTKLQLNKFFMCGHIWTFRWKIISCKWRKLWNKKILFNNTLRWPLPTEHLFARLRYIQHDHTQHKQKTASERDDKAKPFLKFLMEAIIAAAESEFSRSFPSHYYSELTMKIIVKMARNGSRYGSNKPNRRRQQQLTEWMECDFFFLPHLRNT
jgi:hypothetical protein